MMERRMSGAGREAFGQCSYEHEGSNGSLFYNQMMSHVS